MTNGINGPDNPDSPEKKPSGSGNSIKSSSSNRNSLEKSSKPIDQIRKSGNLSKKSIVNTSRRESAIPTSKQGSPTDQSKRASGLSDTNQESIIPTSKQGSATDQSKRASGLSDTHRESIIPPSKQGSLTDQSKRASGLSDTHRESIIPISKQNSSTQQSKRASGLSESRRESENSKHNPSASTPHQSIRVSLLNKLQRKSVNSKHSTSVPQNSQIAINNFTDNPNQLSNGSIIVEVLSSSHQASSKHSGSDPLTSSNFVENLVPQSDNVPIHHSSFNDVDCLNQTIVTSPTEINAADNEIEDPHTNLARILFDETDIEPNTSAELIYSRGDEKPNTYKNVLESAAKDILQVIEKLNGAIQEEDNCSLVSVKSQLNCLHTKLIDRSNNQKQKKPETVINLILNQKTRKINEFQEQRVVDGNLRTFKKKDIHDVYEKIIGHNSPNHLSCCMKTDQDNPDKGARQVDPDICTLKSYESIFNPNELPENGQDINCLIIKPTLEDRNDRNKYECRKCQINDQNRPEKLACDQSGNVFNQNGVPFGTTTHPNQNCPSPVINRSYNYQPPNFPTNQQRYMNQVPENNNKTQTYSRTNQIKDGRNDFNCTITGYDPGRSPYQLCCTKCNQNNLPPCTIVHPPNPVNQSLNGNNNTCILKGCVANNSTNILNDQNQPYIVSTSRNEKTFTIPDYNPNKLNYQPIEPNQMCQASFGINDKTFLMAGAVPNNMTYQSTEPTQTYQGVSFGRNDTAFPIVGPKNVTYLLAEPNKTYQTAPFSRNDTTFPITTVGPNNNMTYVVTDSSQMSQKLFGGRNQSSNPNETYQISSGQTYNFDPSGNTYVNSPSAGFPDSTFIFDKYKVNGSLPYKGVQQQVPQNFTQTNQTNDLSYTDFSDKLVSTPSSPHTPSLNSTMQQQYPEDQAGHSTFISSYPSDHVSKRTFDDFFQLKNTSPPSDFFNNLTPPINTTFNVSEKTMNRSSLERNYQQTQEVYNLIQEAFRTEPFNLWVVQNFFNMINGLKGILGWNDVLLCIADNIGEFTAIKVFNRLTFSELGHFSLSKSDIDEIYKCGLLDLFQYVRNKNLHRDPLALDRFTPSVARMIQADLEEPGKPNCNQFIIFVKVFLRLSFYIMRKIKFRKIFWKFFVGPSFDEPAMELLYNVQTNLKNKMN